MDCIALVKCDVVSYSLIEASFRKSKADFICGVSTSVTDVNKLGDERKLVLLYLSVGDDRRCKIGKR